MRTVGKTILEMLLLGCVAVAIAFGANAMRAKGSLDVNKNYFSRRPINPKATAPPKEHADDPKPAEASPAGSTVVTPTPAVPESANANAGAPAEETHPDHGYQDISFAEVQAVFNDPMTASGANVFIDARNDASFEEGHIPGALQCDHYELDNYMPDVLPLAEGAEKVIVYCNGGDCEDSIFMCQDLLSAGVSYDALYLFSGGWQAWKAGGMPIGTGREE